MRNLVTLVEDLPVFSPELRMIEPYKEIIVRDKGSAGDTQARKKLIATKELGYIFFMVDYRSPYLIGYSETIRPQVIKARLGLSKEWKEDELIRTAMKVYAEDQETASSKSLCEVRQTLFTCVDLIGILRKNIESNVKKYGELTAVETEDEEELEKIDNVLNKSLSNLNKLLSTATKLPETISTISELEERVKVELGKESKGRRGREINEFEK